jgi:hypothetical protein
LNLLNREVIVAEEHDNWFKDTLGIDVDHLRQAVASTASPLQTDPSAVAGTLKEIGQGISDGVRNTGQTISDLGSRVVQSDTVQTLNQAGNTLGKFERGVGEGFVSGVGDLLDMSPAGQVVKGVQTVGRIATADDSAAEFGKVVDEKIDSAVTTAKFVGNVVIDPEGTGAAIGTQIRRDFNQAAAQGDGAEFIGKGVGKGIVIAATVAATAGAGGAAAAGEEGAAVLGDTGAAALGRSGVAVGDGAAATGPGGAAVSDGAATLGRVVEDAPVSSIGGSSDFAEPFGNVPPSQAPDLPPDLPPVSAPTEGPITPRVSIPGEDPPIIPAEDPPVAPAPDSSPPDTLRDPPFEISPPSQLPDGPPPDTQPIPVKPGFPFGTDDP